MVSKAPLDVAVHGSFGGGIFSATKHDAIGVQLNISNSTISGNSANEGGGIYTRAGVLILNNSTVAFNLSPVGVGGIVSQSGGCSCDTLPTSSIIARNKSPNPFLADMATQYQFVGSHNLIATSNGLLTDERGAGGN